MGGVIELFRLDPLEEMGGIVACLKDGSADLRRRLEMQRDRIDDAAEVLRDVQEVLSTAVQQELFEDEQGAGYDHTTTE